MKPVFEIESQAAPRRADTSLLGFDRRAQGRDGAPAHFDALQRQLLQQRTWRLEEIGEVEAVRRAANEAAAIAWLTDVPLLVFPSLFEEMSAIALANAQHQRFIYAKSWHLLTRTCSTV